MSQIHNEARDKKMNDSLKELIERCMKELNDAHENRHITDQADRVAALFLDVQMQLADYIVELDFKTKMAKNELSRVEGVKYFDYKSAPGADKKMTDAAVQHAIAKDEEVFKVKTELAQHESNQKKWANVMGIMNNGHIFFRTISKNIQ